MGSRFNDLLLFLGKDSSFPVVAASKKSRCPVLPIASAILSLFFSLFFFLVIFSRGHATLELAVSVGR